MIYTMKANMNNSFSDKIDIDIWELKLTNMFRLKLM